MSNVAYLVTADNVTISKGGKTLMVNRQYANFQGVIDKLKKRDFDAAFELADKALSLVKQSKGVFTVDKGIVYRDGLPVHNVVVDRIIQFQEQGLPFEPLIMFLKNLMSNPSERAIKELYTFLENKYLPITEDGYFLAYKAVNPDFTSITSGDTLTKVSSDGGKTWREVTGHIPNNIGNIIEVDRKDVDSSTAECSFGLHAGAIKYVNGFAHSDSRKVIVKINPRDAVAVPRDESFQKLRASRYEVVSELITVIEKPLVKKSAIVQKPKNVIKTIEGVNKDMVLTLTRVGKFLEKDIARATEVIEDAARKFLKLRAKNGIFSKVIGNGEINGNRLALEIHLPLDTRYTQPSPEKFNKAYQSGLKRKLTLTGVK